MEPKEISEYVTRLCERMTPARREKFVGLLSLVETVLQGEIDINPRDAFAPIVSEGRTTPVAIAIVDDLIEWRLETQADPIRAFEGVVGQIGSLGEWIDMEACLRGVSARMRRVSVHGTVSRKSVAGLLAPFQLRGGTFAETLAYVLVRDGAPGNYYCLGEQWGLGLFLNEEEGAFLLPKVTRQADRSIGIGFEYVPSEERCMLQCPAPTYVIGVARQ